MKAITASRCILPRDYQQDEPEYRCTECGAEIYRGSAHFLWFGEIICQECMEEITHDGAF